MSEEGKSLPGDSFEIGDKPSFPISGVPKSIFTYEFDEMKLPISLDLPLVAYVMSLLEYFLVMNYPVLFMD